MFHSTSQYNLTNGDDGRTVIILKELLYQIPQIRNAVPEVVSSSQINDKFDDTAQAAVSFFQKWQNLKLRDGNVNHETWITLGNFTTESKVEFLTNFDPVLKIMLSGASLKKNNTNNLVLWPSQYGYLTHQNSVRRVLTNSLSTKDLNRLLFAILGC